MILPITLSTFAAAAILAMWLGMRVGRVRAKEKISHGDGGNVLLGRRMRAQLNYVEYTPFVLLLIGAIELSGRGGLWLAIVAGAYMLVRLLHAIGMDDDVGDWKRMAGIMGTMLALLGLGIYAALIAAGVA
jgi:uncharacterized membrane protein YecN with MAPEG domain